MVSVNGIEHQILIGVGELDQLISKRLVGVLSVGHLLQENSELQNRWLPMVQRPTSCASRMCMANAPQKAIVMSETHS